MADEAGYNGVFGAFPYAFRRTDSWLCRTYVVVSALAALGISLLIAMGLVVLIAQTAAVKGGSLTLSRAFYVVIGLFLVGPLVAPTLLVARRHRRGEARGRWYDVALGVAGYLFLVSLYVGLVITVPPSQQTPQTGLFAPVVEVLFALPQPAGVVPPLVGIGLIALAHRLSR